MKDTVAHSLRIDMNMLFCSLISTSQREQLLSSCIIHSLQCCEIKPLCCVLLTM